MLIVVSPAKKLDYDTPAKTKTSSMPEFLEHSQILIDRLRQFSAMDIAELMHLSMKLAELNFDRYADWSLPLSTDNAKQAMFAFKGDVYTGLDADSFSSADIKFAQKHFRMLSGLYGLLRPLDLMFPYRLEMGTRLDNERGKNLYEFWGSIITDAINKQLKASKSQHLINLASNEYFKSVKTKAINAEIITPAFKEYKNGEYKMIGIYAKKARGLLSRYIIQNQLSKPDDIKAFDEEGYTFNQKASKGNNWVFTRRQ
ncbi:MAG: peroxide stress protein YaaA [Gammaproteobacteria bacterium]|nr:peroxide stress protein YaaA [Gammaproteobacteria bacterium]